MNDSKSILDTSMDSFPFGEGRDGAMKIVIIGNGVAGTNAARYIRKLSDNEIVMISDETLKPFSRTALMYIYMGHVKQESTELYEDWFWEKNRIQRVQARVMNIDAEAKTLLLNNGESIVYDKLIIATGSKSNKFGWKGQDLKGVSGLYHLQDLENIEAHSKGLKRAVIVGGGLIGIELAEMFHSRNIAVTFLVREQSFWDLVLPKEESAMINRHILEHHIDLRLGAELDEIIGDENGVVKAVRTKTGEIIECGYVGLTVGVSPNTSPILTFPKGEGIPSEPLPFGRIEVGRGILVDEYLTTSNPDVYAIGDCVELRSPQVGRRPIEAIWYTGRMMGQTVAHTICGKPTKYVPRLWFNSAKFLDIEYQVYGEVLAKNPEGVQSLYWEHPNGKKAIRITYSSPLGRSGGASIKGFNLMGIRYRHEVCEKWILEGASIEEVLQNLSLANFDPEFFDEYEKKLINQYNQLTNSRLVLKSKRNLNLVTRFLRNF
jgi:NADPH-dependent 2,4-dienoyl-CoA reductase/sulfur reductase-like enzyme